MPVTWDDAKERQFLLAIIHVNNLTGHKWDLIADLLNAQSSTSDFVGNALRQRFAKMKKTAEEQFGAMPAPADADGTAPKTPSKRAKKSDGETPAKSTSKRKAKKAASAEEEEGANKDSEEDSSASSRKKVKAEAVENDEI